MSGPAGWLEGIRGVLLDVDGTLWEGGRAIPGAAGALERLRAAEIPFRLTTNTTRKPRSAIAAALGRVGIGVDAAEILVPASLAARRIAASGRLRTGLLVPEACLEDLDGVEPVRDAPDWVVVGDLGRGFTFDRLNRAFRWLKDGARLLALQRGAFWISEAGQLDLDAGPFVAALEYAAGVKAELVGKPATAFFQLALDALGVPPGEALVAGDDMENDIRGGREAGLRTLLVRTGKGREPGGGRPVRPDLELDSIAGLRPRPGS